MKDASSFDTDNNVLQLISSIQKGDEIDFNGVQKLSTFNRIFSFYYANFVLYENDILSEQSWKPFHRELCGMLENKSVKRYVDQLTDRGYLPSSFSSSLASCQK